MASHSRTGNRLATVGIAWGTRDRTAERTSAQYATVTKNLCPSLVLIEQDRHQFRAGHTDDLRRTATHDQRRLKAQPDQTGPGFKCRLRAEKVRKV